MHYNSYTVLGHLPDKQVCLLLIVKAADSLISDSFSVTHPTTYAGSTGPPHCPAGTGATMLILLLFLLRQLKVSDSRVSCLLL